MANVDVDIRSADPNHCSNHVDGPRDHPFFDYYWAVAAGGGASNIATDRVRIFGIYRCNCHLGVRHEPGVEHTKLLGQMAVLGSYLRPPVRRFTGGLRAALKGK